MILADNASKVTNSDDKYNMLARDQLLFMNLIAMCMMLQAMGCCRLTSWCVGKSHKTSFL
jgi:hypothetical protein